ncbi:hypothetical protein TNCV_3157451 [Trichonephila clavipes]|nr:hypothetical protein TNCV_3157451 [Trichonephila clavipes]
MKHSVRNEQFLSDIVMVNRKPFRSNERLLLTCCTIVRRTFVKVRHIKVAQEWIRLDENVTRTPRDRNRFRSKSGLCQYEIICGHTFVAKLTEKEKNWRGAYPRTEPTTPGTVAVQHNHQAKVITPFKRLLLADEDTTTVLLH